MSGLHLHLDPFAGIAGDMFCGALIELGADREAMERGLRGLGLEGWRIEVRRVQRGPFAATRFEVLGDDGRPVEAPPHGHTHPSRGWREIREMIRAADLPARARERALATFGALAEAEGRVHGVSSDEVHFHEVGAVDAIVDVVGAALLLESLDITSMTCGPLPLGSGIIRSAHGRIPLPAPAVLELLRGWPVRSGPEDRETVTPTGAALIAALAEPGPIPAMTLRGVGHGAGRRNPTDIPNVLRAVLGTPAAPPAAKHIDVVSAEIDDVTGEHLPPLLDALLGAGALDAFAVPVLMKKGRPGLWVQALVEPARLAAVEEAFLRHSTTFGVRRYPAERRVLERWYERVETPWGPVRVKVGALEGEVLHATPEFEDVRAVAAASGQPVPSVHAAAVHAWQNRRTP